MWPLHRCVLSATVLLALLFAPVRQAVQKADGWTLLPHTEAQSYIALVSQSDDFAVFHKSLELVVAQTDTAVALERPGRVLVVIPLAYRGDEKGATFAVTFDASTQAVLASVGIAAEVKGELHRVRIWVDGAQAADLDIDTTQTVVSGWRMRDGVREELRNFRDTAAVDRMSQIFESQGFTDLPSSPTSPTSGDPALSSCINQLGVQPVSADYASCVNDCLASAGIPSYIITAITIACIPICVITAGAGCIACATLAGAVFVGTVTTCLIYCYR